MHELSLAEDMLIMIEEQSRTQAFKQVKRVTLKIGALSHVEEQAMRFCFESVMKGSLAEKAKLVIEPEKGLGLCPSCQHETPMQELYAACSNCGQFGLQILRGDQVKVTELEVI